jgi:hypothetical protein
MRVWPGPDAQAGRATVAIMGIVFAVFSTLALIAAGAKPIAAAICSSLGLLHIECIRVAGALMSDVPCAAVYAIAMWHWYRTRWASAERGMTQAVMAGMLAGAAFAIRVAGLTLVAGLLAGALAGGHRLRAGGVLLGFAFVVFPMKLWLASHPPAQLPEVYSSDLSHYSNQSVGEIIEEVGLRAAKYAAALTQVLAPILETNAARKIPFLELLIFLLTVGLLVTVFAANRAIIFDRIHLPFAVFFLATFLLMSIWPYDLHLRPFIAFSPAIIYGLWCGTAEINARIGRWAAWLICGSAILCFLATTSYCVKQMNATRVPRSVADCLNYLRNQTPEDAVIVTHFPEATYMATGRLAFKEIPDRNLIIGRLGDWSSIDAQLAACPGHPVYMWGVSTSASAFELNYSRLREAAPGRIHIVFLTSDNNEWVARVDPLPVQNH